MTYIGYGTNGETLYSKMINWKTKEAIVRTNFGARTGLNLIHGG